MSDAEFVENASVATDDKLPTENVPVMTEDQQATATIESVLAATASAVPNDAGNSEMYPQVSPEIRSQAFSTEYSSGAPTPQCLASTTLPSTDLLESPTERHESHDDLNESPMQVHGSQTETHMFSSDLSDLDLTNSQLDPRKKTRRRGSAWNDDQTDYLMEVWARHTDSTGTEDYTVTNAPIYRIISKSMGELGYLDKSSDQCKTRIHTLKRAYKLTKAEIDAGASNITFCRHYEKLRIIMGDEPSTTPKQLAEILLEKRRQKKLSGVETVEVKPNKIKNKESKVKRTLDLASTDKSLPVPPKQQNKEVSQAPAIPVVPLPAVSSLWNSQGFTFPFPVPPVPNIAFPETSYISAPLTTTTPTYPTASVTPQKRLDDEPCDINHNTYVVVKQEKTEPDEYPIFQTPLISKTSDSVSQTKEEIERMRLDLEMKKIEIERNRLEMEERQRREDRDHQYRMMQLLLMGLGHNPGVGTFGQGAETEEANQPELSRALEGGLVPGGAQSANEKGLSFSEI